MRRNKIIALFFLFVVVYPAFLTLTMPILAYALPPEGVPPPEGYGSEAEAIGGLFSYNIQGLQRVNDTQPLINPLGIFQFADSPSIQISEGGQQVVEVESLGKRWVTNTLPDGNKSVTAVFVHKYTVQFDLTFETIVQPQTFPLINAEETINLHTIELYEPKDGLFYLPDLFHWEVTDTQRRDFTIPYKIPEKDFDQTFTPSTMGWGVVRITLTPSFSFPAVLNTTDEDFYYQYDRFWVGITDVRSDHWTNGTLSDQRILINPAILGIGVDPDEIIISQLDTDHRARYYGTVETNEATLKEQKGYIAGGAPTGRPSDLFIDDRGNTQASESVFYDPTLMDGVNQLSVYAFCEFHLRPRARLWQVTHKWDHLLERRNIDLVPFSSSWGSFVPYSDVYTPALTKNVIVGATIDNSFVHNWYNATVYLVTYYDLVAEETNQDPFIWGENDYADDPFDYYENDLFNARGWGANRGAEYISYLSNQFLYTLIFLIIIAIIMIVVIAVAGIGIWYGYKWIKKRGLKALPKEERRLEVREHPEAYRPLKKWKYGVLIAGAVAVVFIIVTIVLVWYLLTINPLFLYLSNPIWLA
jgi:hypothetical protein